MFSANDDKSCYETQPYCASAFGVENSNSRTLISDLWMLQMLFAWDFMFIHVVFIIIIPVSTPAAHVYYVCEALTYISVRILVPCHVYVNF